MSACNISKEILDIGVKIKTALKFGKYRYEASFINYFLIQYDSICVVNKQELLDSISDTLNSININELSEFDISTQAINTFRNLTDNLKLEFEKEIKKIPFENFFFNNKEYSFSRDVFQWIITDKQIVVLLKEDDGYIEDNLVALDYSGKVLWSSYDCIDCKNRLGACFVSLNDFSENVICACAFIGIEYYINTATAKVCDKKIVK